MRKFFYVLMFAVIACFAVNSFAETSAKTLRYAPALLDQKSSTSKSSTKSSLINVKSSRGAKYIGDRKPTGKGMVNIKDSTIGQTILTAPELNEWAYSQAIGGTGGVDFKDICDDGSVLTALHGRAGDVIDGIQAGCTDIGHLNQIQQPEVWKPYHGGNGGGEFYLFAPSGSALAQFDAKAGEYKDNWVLTEFAPTFAKIDFKNGKIIKGRQELSKGKGDADYPWQASQCPEGYLPVGILGRADTFVDNLSFICRKLYVAGQKAPIASQDSRLILGRWDVTEPVGNISLSQNIFLLGGAKNSTIPLFAYDQACPDQYAGIGIELSLAHELSGDEIAGVTLGCAALNQVSQQQVIDEKSVQWITPPLRKGVGVTLVNLLPAPGIAMAGLSGKYSKETFLNLEMYKLSELKPFGRALNENGVGGDWDQYQKAGPGNEGFSWEPGICPLGYVWAGQHQSEFSKNHPAAVLRGIQGLCRKVCKDFLGGRCD